MSQNINRQVNIWRGDKEPPTIHHIWVYKDEHILLFDGEEWVSITDDTDVIDKIDDLYKKIGQLQNQLDIIKDYKVNGKKISNNPILEDIDIPSKQDGHYLKNNTVQGNLSVLDQLLVTYKI